MADVAFELLDLNDRKMLVEKLVSFELSRDSDAPCDSVRVNFLSDFELDEMYRIFCYFDDKRVFSGYVDIQTQEKIGDKYKCYIFARSSACLLTDNEANPVSICSPNTQSAFLLFASNMGLKNALPPAGKQSSFNISKGTSLFKALDDVVYYLTNSHVFVNAQDEICLMKKTSIHIIPDDRLLSVKSIINRGCAISSIGYKVSNIVDYNHHCESEFFKNRKIRRSSISNLSSISTNQIPSYLHSVFEEAVSQYQIYKLCIYGIFEALPMDEIRYLDDILVIDSICYKTSRGKTTTLIKAYKLFDTKEKSYVD